MKPGAGRGRRGFRARWTAQVSNPGGTENQVPIVYNGDSRSAWEQAGLMDEVEDPAPDEAPVSSQPPGGPPCEEDDPAEAERPAGGDPVGDSRGVGGLLGAAAKDGQGAGHLER